MKACGGNAVIAPLIPDFGIKRRWVFNVTPRYPPNRMLGEPQNQSGRFGKERESLDSNPGSPRP